MQRKSTGHGKTLRAERERLWERQQDVFMCGERLGKTWDESEPYVRTAQVWGNVATIKPWKRKVGDFCFQKERCMCLSLGVSFCTTTVLDAA